MKELNIKTFRKKEGKIPSLEDQEEAYIQWVLSEVGRNKTLASHIGNRRSIALEKAEKVWFRR